MHRTILICLDGATFTVLDSLIADGLMPNLETFAASGVKAELLSTPHPLTPPAWTTLMTGRSPGNHGIFDFIWAEERGDNVYFTLNNFRDIQAETIWTMVSRQQGRVTSLNFPHMSPPPALNGEVVPGLVSWKHMRRNVHPPELYARLQTLPGFSAKEAAWDFDQEKRATQVIPESEHEAWVTHHIRREQQWFEIFRYLAEDNPSDLSAVLIDGVDKLQHICWRELDPKYSGDLPTPAARRVRQLCLDYFKSLDEFIGQVITSAGSDARIFIASDHGFGPTEKVFRANLWLAERGYLSWAPTDELDEVERKKVDKLVTRHFVYLDWENTVAYASSAATNGIHIRVAGGSSPGGIKESEYEAFRDRLIEELLEIRDPDGTQIVTRVLKKEDVFPGTKNQRCPDLTLVLHDHGFLSTINQEPIHWTRPLVAGTHRPEGVFLARGPGVPEGVVLPEQSILDAAPTFLYSLGLPIPSDLEGQVIREAFTSSQLERHPVRIGSPTEAPTTITTNKVQLSACEAKDEEKIILERLRALGYVE